MRAEERTYPAPLILEATLVGRIRALFRYGPEKNGFPRPAAVCGAWYTQQVAAQGRSVSGDPGGYRTGIVARRSRAEQSQKHKFLLGWLVGLPRARPTYGVAPARGRG